jgi:hypothetical protein
MQLAVPGTPGVLIALLLLLLGAVGAWRVALLRSGNSPAAIALGREATIAIETRQGERIETVARAPRHVTRLSVILRTDARQCRTLLLTAGMMGAEEFRRLRVWALWGGVPGAAAATEPA